MDLPKNESSFFLTVVGDTTERTYDGEFTVICVPNIMQRRAIEVEKTRFASDLKNPTDHLSGLAVCLSNLRVRIVKAPSWWNDSNGGSDLLDENVLVVLYDKVMSQEDEWRTAVKKKGASESEDELQGKTQAERK